MCLIRRGVAAHPKRGDRRAEPQDSGKDAGGGREREQMGEHDEEVERREAVVHRWVEKDVQREQHRPTRHLHLRVRAARQ